MWIKLGSTVDGSSLLPRFERIYHPTELSHFDKFFAKPWSQPSRLSHEDSHTSIDDDVEGIGMAPRKTPIKESKASLYDERVQSSKIRESSTRTGDGNNIYQSLDDFININGFGSKNRTTLNQLLKAHNQQSHATTSAETQDKHCE
jgi:hypothetical protein